MERASWLNSTVAMESTNTECGRIAISSATFAAYSPGTLEGESPVPLSSSREAVAPEISRK